MAAYFPKEFNSFASLGSAGKVHRMARPSPLVQRELPGEMSRGLPREMLGVTLRGIPKEMLRENMGGAVSSAPLGPCALFM